MFKAVIFDVDGTLVDSVDAHAHAWQDAFQEFGYTIAFPDIRQQIGKGGDQLLPVFLSEAQRSAQGEALEQRRGEILRTKYLPHIRAFADVRPLFERLQQDGKTIALASSAKDAELKVYKRVAGIEDLVEEETTSEDAEKSKPHPDIFQAALDRLSSVPRDATLVIGDTPYDAEAAGKAGLRTVGVLCGGFSEASLREAGCIAIYRDPQHLLQESEAAVLSGG